MSLIQLSVLLILQIALQELSNREEALKQMEESLESFKRKYSVAMHQQVISHSPNLVRGVPVDSYGK